MRKRIFSVLIALVLGTSLLLAACATPAPAPAPTPAPAPAPAPAKVYNWKYAGIVPPAVVDHKLHLWWAESVRTMSGGRINTEVYAAAELVPSVDLGTAVAEGMITLAHTCGGYHMGQIPTATLEGASMPPFLYRSMADLMQLYEQWGVWDLMMEDFAEHGILLFDPVFTGATTFWTKTPLDSVEGLSGLKMRLWPGFTAKMFEALGVELAFIPHEEVPTALATGVVDCSGTAVNRYFTQELYTFCPYIYKPALYDASGQFLIINPDAWNELPDDLQEIVRVVTIAQRYEMHTQSEAVDAKGYARAEELGITVMNWSPADIKKFVEASVSTLPELAAMSPRCAEAAAIMEDFARAKGYIN